MSKKNDVVVSIIQKKKAQLEKILYSEDPTNLKLIEGHLRKVQRSKVFLEELEDFKYFLDTPVRVVPLVTFNKTIKKSDFVEIEMDGIYCKVASVQSFPYEFPMLIGYIASVSSL